MKRLLIPLLALLAALGLGCGTRRSGPGFALSAGSAQVRVLPGLDQTLVLTLQPDPGFSGRVELSASGLGADLEATFSPAAVTLSDGAPASSTLRLVASESAAAGPREVTLQAAGGGRAAALALAVEIPAASFFTVMTYRGVDLGNWAYLTYQDGDGPWTAVPGRGGVYRLPITDPGGRFGVLLGDICQGETSATWISNGYFNALKDVQLLQALVFCNPSPGPPAETFDLRGQLDGAGGTTVLVSGNGGLYSFPPGSTDYTMKLLRGPGDLVAAAYPSTQDYRPSRILLERGLDIQGATVRNLDFDLQAHLPPAPLPIQRPVLDAEETFQGSVQFQTARGQVAILGYGQELSSYTPFPSAAVQPGDSHSYAFQAVAPGRYRGLQAGGIDAPGALAPQLPTAIPPFTAGYLDGRVRLAWSAVSPSPSVHEVVLVQNLPGRQAYAYCYFGPGWHRGAAQLAWALPDLSQVPGFDPGFFPRPGASAQISIYQSGNQGAGPLAPMASPPLPLTTPPAAPPSAPWLRPSLGLERPRVPGLQLRTTGPAGYSAAAGVRTEYWASVRSQALLP